MPLDAVFNLDVPHDLVFQRLSGRWVHPKVRSNCGGGRQPDSFSDTNRSQSGRIYNEHFSPPAVKMRDDETGEPLVRRPDDEPESVKHRLSIYEKSTAPILEFFKRRLGDKLHAIPCETSKEGYAKMKPILQSIAAQKR